MKNVAVIGSTGVQGGGVVSALLSDPAFKVIGITSNRTSQRASFLLDKYSDKVKEGRFELMEGNLDDEKSLVKALDGCELLFASWGPGATPKQGEVAEELQQGMNLVNAAKVSVDSLFPLLPSFELTFDAVSLGCRCQALCLQFPIKSQRRE